MTAEELRHAERMLELGEELEAIGRYGSSTAARLIINREGRRIEVPRSPSDDLREALGYFLQGSERKGLLLLRAFATRDTEESTKALRAALLRLADILPLQVVTISDDTYPAASLEYAESGPKRWCAHAAAFIAIPLLPVLRVLGFGIELALAFALGLLFLMAFLGAMGLVIFAVCGLFIIAPPIGVVAMFALFLWGVGSYGEPVQAAPAERESSRPPRELPWFRRVTVNPLLRLLEDRTTPTRHGALVSIKRFSDQRWKPMLQDAIRKADVVVIDVTRLTPALRWELAQIEALGKQSSTLLVCANGAAGAKLSGGFQRGFSSPISTSSVVCDDLQLEQGIVQRLWDFPRLFYWKGMGLRMALHHSREGPAR